MDALQHLQPVDVVFALVWAVILAWGLLSGVVRQVGMLIGVYGATVVAGSVYRALGTDLSMAFGREHLAELEFVAYTAVFLVGTGLIGMLIGRTYSASRVGHGIGLDATLGLVVAALWGVLLLIGLLTVLRFYVAIGWREQEATQRVVLGQLQRSQVAPVLEVVAAPLWQAMAPWFPAPVPGRL